MKTHRITPKSKSSGGYALLIVLAMGAVSAIILGNSITWTINTAMLNERNNQSAINLSAAEAATENVIAHMMADCRKFGMTGVSNNIAAYQGMVPQADPYWGQFEFSDGEGNVGQTCVTVVSNNTYARLESQYSGLYGWVTTYRVLSNARQTTGRFTTVTNAVQQEIQIASIPIFQFAFFYNGLMEFTAAKDLTINGRVHANGDIFYSSSGPITFNAPVTTTGTIQKKAVWGMSGSSSGTTTFNGTPDYRTNIAQLSLSIGTNNTSANLHKIIEIPPSGEDANSLLGRERFYNKAGIVLLVSNTLVTAMIKSSASNTIPPYFLHWTNSAPYFMNTAVVFWDRRESKWMKTTQIDIQKLGEWFSTNDDVEIKHPTNVFYVADNRTFGIGTNTAVRLTNATELMPGLNSGDRATGFTVATPNPLYIKGNYNSTYTIPAVVVCDALTILSSRWNDAESIDEDPHNARTTTVNAAIITGSVPSGLTGNAPFSGGVMNLPRLLENWSTRYLTNNTSLVNLFESVKATGSFTESAFNPPQRWVFNHDPGFANPDKLPPGTPMLSVLIRARWSSPPPNTTTYAGD